LATQNKNYTIKDFSASENYSAWGMIHLENKNYDEALKCFQLMTEIDPYNPKHYINMGYAYEK